MTLASCLAWSNSAAGNTPDRDRLLPECLCAEKTWDAVDFRLMGVSVLLVKFNLRIKQSVTVAALLIFFTLGAFAISLAYEPASEGPLYTPASPNHGSRHGLLGSDTFAQKLAIFCLSGDVPRSVQPIFQSYRINYVRVVDPVELAFPLENHVPKVSLQILQSVLLI
ncbi:MAG TPA: hypothetical protein VMR88_01365 [Candidatus Polarisedimenticolaceae bacterium]|nr:hypothetical protein [Candidatus Polarisedimenticolaceae bacterium]